MQPSRDSILITALLTKFRSAYWSWVNFGGCSGMWRTLWGVPLCVTKCDRGRGCQNWSKIAWRTLWTAPNLHIRIYILQFWKLRQIYLSMWWKNVINFRSNSTWHKKIPLPCSSGPRANGPFGLWLRRHCVLSLGSGVNLVWNLGVVDSGKKINFSRKISENFDFSGNLTSKKSIFQGKFPKNFDFFM